MALGLQFIVTTQPNKFPKTQIAATSFLLPLTHYTRHISILQHMRLKVTKTSTRTYRIKAKRLGSLFTPPIPRATAAKPIDAALPAAL